MHSYQSAKENLETRYAVVGLAGDIKASLEVMESYIPRFFKGARDVYDSLGQDYRRNREGFLKAECRHFISEAEFQKAIVFSSLFVHHGPRVL